MNLVGEHVGNYVVTRELGAGGMGTVYLAEHPLMKRKVAVKVLHDEHTADPDTVNRFFQEARAAAEIGEEHIIEVIDFGEMEVRGAKVVYLMMELLDGQSLGHRIAAGPMPPDEVAHVALQVCAALAASHAKGIIHRDLKPENIYLCPRASDPTFVKVLDFGIAKLTGQVAPSGRATRIGTVLGTPAYMSPEQCVGLGGLDGRADIYAFGIVLYEMLTGQLPFGGDIGALLASHLQRVPEPPSARLATIPPAWDAIVLHCLEKGRDDRFPAMADLAAAIRDPAAHLATYTAQVQARAAARQGHHTAILPPELRPAGFPGFTLPTAAGGSAGGLQVAGPAPTPVPFAPPPANVGPAVLPQGTPAPFYAPTLTPTAATAALYPTPVPRIPADASPPPARAPRSLAGILGVIGAVGALIVIVLAIVLLRTGADDAAVAPLPTTPVTAPTPPVRAPAAVPPDAAVMFDATVMFDAGGAAPVDAAQVAPARPVAPAAAAGGVPTPPPVVAPAAVRVTIASVPTRARITVRRAGALVTGTTPFALALPADAGAVSITLTAPGYQPLTRAITARDGETVTLRLERAAPRRRPPRVDDNLLRPD